MPRFAVFLAFGCLSALTMPARAQQVASGHRDILLQATRSWNGKAYDHYPATAPELTMIRLTIPAHTALPWHTHPVPNAGYVLEGQLTIHDQASGRTETFHQGEAFAESVNAIHRGETGDTPTVVLLTYAGTPGTPTSVPAKGEKPEY
ncbi:cupin 2 barrel domain-containing protein [Gluconacetobacter sp. SXCC-1]|uniref:Cupin domain-containing protein n=1 Tax=Komagataeibacter rhaeticus TaxID=215221 RepID=A0A181CE08_9PROT|nr:cupin domain-containing protein [Komagataeibacter xylinus]EGG78146.1 cupin 2 barrel domain-containing protein [Gluconacetobacter sp. SXCC-1]KDU96658.1 cupin [Komagataeibacter rhaeticus AF1]QIP36400.1 cupin domain-containing protein [Komagataeibacter rhaeticus]QOC46169.1 cupin domain-containing protein [Komagataeibacter rhaeticus]